MPTYLNLHDKGVQNDTEILKNSDISNNICSARSIQILNIKQKLLHCKQNLKLPKNVLPKWNGFTAIAK